MASKYPLSAQSAAAALALVTSLGTAITVGNIMGDPTTARGDMSYRGDAGGGTTAQTRLPVGTSGQVLTVASGEPTWAAPAGSSPTTIRGDLIRRGASADERLALGTAGQVLTSDGTDPAWAAPGAWACVTLASWTARNGSGSNTASVASGRLVVSLDGATTAVYNNTTRSAPRAYYAPSATAHEVALIFRLYQRTAGSADADLAVFGILRGGSDDTAAYTAPATYYSNAGVLQVQQFFPIAFQYNATQAPWWGDITANTYQWAGDNISWPANSVVNTYWLGVRWSPGVIQYGVKASSSTAPTVEQMLWMGRNYPTWEGPPGLAIVGLMQASASAQTVEIDGQVCTR